MPPDHLTHPPAAGGADALISDEIFTALTGAGLTITGGRACPDPQDLADAVAVYRAGGQAALAQRADSDWYQARVQFLDWAHAETTAVMHLRPALDTLRDKGAIGDWWFLRKHPCWRLRLRHADSTLVDGLLDELASAGVLAGWTPGIYESETIAFGGPTAMSTIHDLFCADSHGVLDYLQYTHRLDSATVLGRRELSLLLLNALLTGAGLDWFERGDVFGRVARIRPAQPDPRTERLADQVRPLLTAPLDASQQVFAAGDLAAFAAPWLDAFAACGRTLGAADATGKLDRGLRALLTHIVIFHWNRLGLSAAAQGLLARAAQTAFLPEK